MSIGFMSTETIGEKLRHIREEKELPLRKVAALLDIDVAILSKMERGERIVRRSPRCAARCRLSRRSLPIGFIP